MRFLGIYAAQRGGLPIKSFEQTTKSWPTSIAREWIDSVKVKSLECPFSEEVDDLEVIQDLFMQIDTDNSKSISCEELQAALERPGLQIHHKKIADAFVMLMRKVQDTGREINMDDFILHIKQLPRVQGQRVQWARSLNLELEVAALLRKGNFFDGLAGLKEMSDAEIADHVAEVSAKFCKRFPIILTSKLHELRSPVASQSSKYINTKFSLDVDDNLRGNFAKLEDYYDGPEKLAGSPNPNVEEGICREHCERSNAAEQYSSPNYKFTFTPEQEYEFVTDPREGVEYPHSAPATDRRPFGRDAKNDHRRHFVPLQQFMEKPERRNLHKCEVVALRLYTGPMYSLYNAVLRKSPAQVLEKLSGNQYETTIFCIISGVKELSKDTSMPMDRRVYRGLSGMIPPDQFWCATDGFRGGVELGFMSTTTDRRVAMQYSGSDQAHRVVFEITVGRIDIGADLAWLSQYPAEREILFPPLTCLEVVGEPRVQDGILYFPLRANMNLKGLTIKQLESRRKELHMAMANKLREELHISIENKLSEALGRFSKLSRSKNEVLHNLIRMPREVAAELLHLTGDSGPFYLSNPESKKQGAVPNVMCFRESDA